MINFSLYPYARWLLDGSQGDVPGFNIDESEVPPGDGAPAGGMLAAPPTPQYPSWPRAPGSTLGPQNPLTSAPPGNAPGLWVTPGDNLPGFRVNPQDELIGFKLNENDSSRREGTWPDEMPPDAATPEDPNIAQTFSLPPSVEDPAEPAPSGIPDWLYKLATTPLPPLSTTDPRTGRRIVPYGPLVNPVRPYRGFDQNVPTARGLRTDRINSLADLSSVKEPSAYQWLPSTMPGQPADTNFSSSAVAAQTTNLQSAGREVTLYNRVRFA